MKAIRIFVLMLIATGLLSWAIPVNAEDAPDSDPSVSNIHANTYLIEDGDVLIYGDLEIPYAVPPDTPADDAFIIRLIDTDNTTELAAIRPFVFFDNGYNKNMFAFYSDNITWGEAYIIRISQNPAVFTASANSTDYVMPLSAYTESTDHETNQIELAINIIAAANRLEQYYTDYTLLEASAGGTVLSSPTGETYFRGTIYGIQAMAPTLFLVQRANLDMTPRAWTTEQFDTYRDRFEGSFIGASANATATQFGMDRADVVMALVFAMPVSVGAIVVASIKWRRTEPGVIFACVVLITCALMGWVPMALFAVVFQVLGVYIAWVWFGSRST